MRLFNKLEDKETAMDYFEVLIRYIMNAKEGMSEQDLVQTAEQISSEKGEEIMTIAEKLKEEGKKEQTLKMALKLLNKKFGSLPEKYKEKLKSKNEEELELIIENVFDIKELSDLEEYLN